MPSAVHPMTRSRIVGVLSFAVALGFAACRGPLPVDHFEEVPPGSGHWTPIATVPTFVGAPPARSGYLRFVAEGRSNVRSIAAGPGEPSAEKAALAAIRAALEPVLGADAAGGAAAAAAKKLAMVQRACRDEVLTHDLVPGNTLSTVWALWEVAIDDVIAGLPVADWERARAALTAPANRKG